MAQGISPPGWFSALEKYCPHKQGMTREMSKICTLIINETGGDLTSQNFRAPESTFIYKSEHPRFYYARRLYRHQLASQVKSANYCAASKHGGLCFTSSLPWTNQDAGNVQRAKLVIKAPSGNLE